MPWARERSRVGADSLIRCREQPEQGHVNRTPATRLLYDRCEADFDFVSEVGRLAAVTLGPVLECGSGLTALLLGALAARRGVEVWALEHEPEWRRRVAASLRDHKAGQVYLWFSPLSDYG